MRHHGPCGLHCLVPPGAGPWHGEDPGLLPRQPPGHHCGQIAVHVHYLPPLHTHRIHGSHRWLHLGFISFQPSELLKISLLIYLAYFFSKKEKVPVSFTRWYLPFFCIVCSACLVLLKQPDF